MSIKKTLKKRAWGAKKKLKLLNSDISASERELLGEITHNEHTDSWIFFFFFVQICFPFLSSQRVLKGEVHPKMKIQSSTHQTLIKAEGSVVAHKTFLGIQSKTVSRHSPKQLK